MKVSRISTRAAIATPSPGAMMSSPTGAGKVPALASGTDKGDPRA